MFAICTVSYYIRLSSGVCCGGNLRGIHDGPRKTNQNGLSWHSLNVLLMGKKHNRDRVQKSVHHIHRLPSGCSIHRLNQWHNHGVRRHVLLLVLTLGLDGELELGRVVGLTLGHVAIHGLAHGVGLVLALGVVLILDMVC